MMGDAAGLPLPSASPAPAALPAASPATGATATRVATAGAAQDAAAPGPDANLLFDLLMGGQQEAAAMALPSAAPAVTRAAAGEHQHEPAVADPLSSVLAQMPQLPQMPQPMPVPAVPTPPPVAVTDPATAAAAAAAIVALPFALSTGGQGLPVTAPDSAPSASAPFSLPAAVSAAVRPEAGLADAPALRLPPIQQGFVPPAADMAGSPLQEFAAMVADPAAATVDAATPVSSAPVNAMHALGAAQPASTPTVAPAIPQLSQPADPANGYDDGFSGHVAWLAGQRIGQAEIRVVPEHLGAIDIRLQMDGNNVRAEFHSSQPEVRQALEASLPRLREMLGQHGLQLAHAGVGQGQSGQRQSGNGSPQPGHGGGLALPGEAGSPLPPDFRRARGLLDVYA